MEPSDAKAYLERYQAIEASKKQEMQKTSLKENWKQLNAIKRRAARLGINRETHNDEMEVYLLWARLKANYALKLNSDMEISTIEK